MGNAGTAMRLMTGVLAPQRFDSTLVGDESLMRRPMERVVVPLQMMGAHIQTHEGRPPVQIRGTPQLRAIRLQPAGGERAGEVRGAARRAVCGRRSRA